MPARRWLVGVSVAGATLAAAGVALLTVGSPGGGPGVEDATAAVRNAATLSAAAAERSGSAFVRITHGGEIWAERTIQWHGDDLAVSDRAPTGGRGPTSHMRVVDGILYGTDSRGGWVVLGSPESIDPGSGTTPDEYLAAVREDVGGATLRRITDGITGLRTFQRGDRATVYTGAVAAGLIARETGFKEGESIRVLPFGYVAHGEAKDPAARLRTAVTVGADGVVREIAVSWGPGASAWTYQVSYLGLGTTPAPPAPANAKPFPDRSVTR
jgi:hypothetical protein